MIVVTGCDDYYFPGVKALRNSISRNVPTGEIDLHCIGYGDAVLERKIEDIDVKPIMNPQFPEGTKFPVGGYWTRPEWSMPAMYCRVLIPQLFPDERRALWLDADTLVMHSLAELETLDMGGQSTAQPFMGVKPNAQTRTVVRKHCAAVLLFDIETWRQKEHWQGYLDTMNGWEQAHGEAPGAVETLLNEFLKGDVCSLGAEYHHNAKKGTIPTSAKILHFPVIIPWDLTKVVSKPKPPAMIQAVKKLWEPYA